MVFGLRGRAEIPGVIKPNQQVTTGVNEAPHGAKKLNLMRLIGTHPAQRQAKRKDKRVNIIFDLFELWRGKWIENIDPNLVQRLTEIRLLLCQTANSTWIVDGKQEPPIEAVVKDPRLSRCDILQMKLHGLLDDGSNPIQIR